MDASTLQWLVGIAITLLVSGTGSLVPLGIAIWRLAIWLSREFAKRDAAVVAAKQDAALAVQAANERAKIVEQEAARTIADFRVHVAETYVTKDAMADAVKGLQGSIEQVRDLLNQLLMQGAPQPPPRNRRSGG